MSERQNIRASHWGGSTRSRMQPSLWEAQTPLGWDSASPGVGALHFSAFLKVRAGYFCLVLQLQGGTCHDEYRYVYICLFIYMCMYGIFYVGEYYTTWKKKSLSAVVQSPQCGVNGVNPGLPGFLWCFWTSDCSPGPEDNKNYPIPVFLI